ncbi:32 kda heat shock protein [Anaeramoeba flamelloides]|uniref:32 kDa heat shock protein n=1 Tax=Anaeramoeba flamelloides TaxID=1746091 RepID=A0AAV7YJR2_9EUKA|nr:32 kda heat shock protein [Anaeramoeba flamelloides]
MKKETGNGILRTICYEEQKSSDYIKLFKWLYVNTMDEWNTFKFNRLKKKYRQIVRGQKEEFKHSYNKALSWICMYPCIVNIRVMRRRKNYGVVFDPAQLILTRENIEVFLSPLYSFGENGYEKRNMKVYYARWDEDFQLYLNPLRGRDVLLGNPNSTNHVLIRMEDYLKLHALVFLLQIYQDTDATDSRIGKNPKIDHVHVEKIDTTVLPKFGSVSKSLRGRLSSYRIMERIVTGYIQSSKKNNEKKYKTLQKGFHSDESSSSSPPPPPSSSAKRSGRGDKKRKKKKKKKNKDKQKKNKKTKNKNSSPLSENSNSDPNSNSGSNSNSNSNSNCNSSGSSPDPDNNSSKKKPQIKINIKKSRKKTHLNSTSETTDSDLDLNRKKNTTKKKKNKKKQFQTENTFLNPEKSQTKNFPKSSMKLRTITKLPQGEILKLRSKTLAPIVGSLRNLHTGENSSDLIHMANKNYQNFRDRKFEEIDWDFFEDFGPKTYWTQGGVCFKIYVLVKRMLPFEPGVLQITKKGVIISSKLIKERNSKWRSNKKVIKSSKQVRFTEYFEALKREDKRLIEFCSRGKKKRHNERVFVITESPQDADLIIRTTRFFYQKWLPKKRDKKEDKKFMTGSTSVHPYYKNK